MTDLEQLEIMASGIKYVNNDLIRARANFLKTETAAPGTWYAGLKEKHPALYAIHLEYERTMLQAEELRAKRTKEAFRILNPELFTKEEK